MFKISFQGINHSDAVENYSRKKAEKIHSYLSKEDNSGNIEFHIKSHPNHSHQEVSILLKSKDISLNTHSEQADMYAAIDEAAEKMILVVKKEREKIRDAHRKAPTEKRTFES